MLMPGGINDMSAICKVKFLQECLTFIMRGPNVTYIYNTFIYLSLCVSVCLCGYDYRDNLERKFLQLTG